MELEEKNDKSEKNNLNVTAGWKWFIEENTLKAQFTKPAGMEKEGKKRSLVCMCMPNLCNQRKSQVDCYDNDQAEPGHLCC